MGLIEADDGAAERRPPRAEAPGAEPSAEVREATRTRDEFLSIAAHELRTPLTALQLQLDGMVQAMHAMVPEVRAGFVKMEHRLEKAIRNCDRLVDLVDTLLDISRIAGGRLRLDIQEINLAAAVRQVAEDFSELERCGSAIIIDLPARVPLMCDRRRLEQVLSNLLSNAIKYGQGQPIEVHLRVRPESVELIVRDHGIGIAPEDRQSIFLKFERAASARNYSGMGLGLYIADSLVRAHGGHISVGETEGPGATFVVQLPRDATLQR
jgi:two-component system OmpR family sensor kinase